MHAAAGLLLVAVLAAGGSGLPEYEGKTSNDDDTVTVDATGNAWKYDTTGRQPAAEGPQDKYIRADETTCFQLKNTEYVHAVTHTPGACPEDWSSASTNFGSSQSR